MTRSFLLLPQGHVQDHHEAEADREQHGGPVGVLALSHAGNEVFDDHVDHGAGGEAQHEGEDLRGKGREEDGEDAGNGFHGAGEGAVEEGLAFGAACRAQRHGDDGTFREVLDGNTNGQCEGGT